MDHISFTSFIYKSRGVKISLGKAFVMESQLKTKTKHRGGSYCVAGDPGNISCTNGAYTEGISMHKFPSEKRKNLRAQWIKFVQRHRPMWQPSATSRLCSAHLTEDLFTQQYKFDEASSSRRVLLQHAVPSVDVAGVPVASTSTSSQRERRKVKHEIHVCEIFMRINVFL